MNKHIINRPATIQDFDGAGETKSLKSDTVPSPLHEDGCTCLSISLAPMGQGLGGLVPSFFGV